MASASAGTIAGDVTDQNGKPLPGIQVVYERGPNAHGASTVTVFSGADGHFTFPDDYPEAITANAELSTQGLGFRQVDRLFSAEGAAARFTFVLQPTRNQAAMAPASAWLTTRMDREQQAALIMNCIDCHQVPSKEVRNYAGLIDDLQAADPHAARVQSWGAIVKYMDFITTWDRRGAAPDQFVGETTGYKVRNGEAVVNLLADSFVDRMDQIEGYDWGAPIVATENTAIWEYAVPEPNTIREAVMLGNPARLWAADVSANRIVSIDVATGEQKDYEVPTEAPIGPHSLHRGSDGMLWITPFSSSTTARLNPTTGQWDTWALTTDEGRRVGIHDLSFGYEHELLADDHGRVWFSDIGNAGVGYFDPADGTARVWKAPVAEARANDVALYGSASIYGLVMTKDRKEVWYSQLGNGVFGGFNVETEDFIGPFLLPSANAGPRRLTISDDDVMYLALYGTGQLAEFDIKSRKMLGIYDLPDTASAPYAATWDPVRKVVWVASANGNVIQRFDPRTKTFGVLPLPHEGSFLRMIDIDPETGVLVTSTANIAKVVNGPRIALIVDPGDGVYPKKFSPANASAPQPAE
jgi:streptogramin lyase